MAVPVATNIVATSFVEAAEVQLRDILNESGKVLYSSAATLCPGEIYLLGVNPGGLPGAPGTTTVGENLSSFANKTTNDYLDEVWPGRSSLLQTRIKNLFAERKHGVRTVCASNVVFTRSPTEPSYKDFKPIASTCWPVHANVISVVKPRLILVFGSAPFYYLW